MEEITKEQLFKDVREIIQNAQKAEEGAATTGDQFSAKAIKRLAGVVDSLIQISNLKEG